MRGKPKAMPRGSVGASAPPARPITPPKARAASLPKVAQRAAIPVKTEPVQEQQLCMFEQNCYVEVSGLVL
jgi:hypothetical protein